jgi:TonB-dependent receptor
MYQDKDRTFNERRFEYQEAPVARYDGDPNAYFGDHAGIIDSTGNGRYTFGSYIIDQSRPSGNYTGTELISAGFAMIELPIFRDLKFVGGARLETTDITVASQDSTLTPGVLDNNDLLPSINFIYQIEENTNLRLAYGKTLARPNFRELAPYRTFEFLGDYLFAGNADLERTQIDNFDIRIEWFLNPGEILAVSGFYKKFKNPIERTIDIETNNISYKNVDQGIVYGIELEARKALGELVEELRFFQVSANLSLVHSSVDIPANELATIQRFDPNAETTRPLFGQSPYIVNFEVSYVNPEMGTTAGVYVNTFGDRLSEVTLGANPDVYERSRTTVDVVASQKIWRGLSMKVAAKNLLDSDLRKSIEYKGQDYLYSGYRLGRTFSFGFSYSL